MISWEMHPLSEEGTMRSLCLSVLTITLSVTVLSLPSSATAGLNDPPPASLPVHVYSVPGAMKSVIGARSAERGQRS
jgi:hypothetical protein